MKRKRICLILLAAVLLAGTAAASARPVNAARVLICADAREGRILDSSGAVVQLLRFDQRGQAAAGPLVPGDYQVQADGWTAAFTLRTNAAVSCVTGDGWSDGEILHLSSRTTGSLTIRFEGDWRWTLEGETAGQAVPRLLEDGGGRCCVFARLPLGSYRLHGPDGDLPLLLTEEDPAQTLDLRPRTGNTAEIFG